MTASVSDFRDRYTVDVPDVVVIEVLTHANDVLNQYYPASRDLYFEKLPKVISLSPPAAAVSEPAGTLRNEGRNFYPTTAGVSGTVSYTTLDAGQRHTSAEIDMAMEYLATTGFRDWQSGEVRAVGWGGESPALKRFIAEVM